VSLLDPRVLAKLGNTQLRARAVVEGVLTGLHRSPHQGQSVEFAEHKDYAPGDDIRHLDWKAWGKLDRYYVKRFEQETNLKAFLVVDASASMGYRGGDRLSKLEYAQTLAASLGYLLVRQQDAVGVVVARGKELGYLPPRAALGHLPAILGTLEAAAAAGPTDLQAAADLVAEKAGRRAQVFVFSDLFDFSPGALRRLADLRRMKHEVAIFHLLDPDELEFPFEDATRFEGLEGEPAIEVDPRSIRASYLEEIAAFCAEAKAACREADVEYEAVRTDAPLDRLLLGFLARRNGGRR
jgi:uncharacterized protein (DUF58 family)